VLHWLLAQQVYCRQAGRQAVKQAGRQAGRQTGI